MLKKNGGPIVFERGEGTCLFDTDGNRWLDSISSLWVVNVGHGRKSIADVLAKQASTLAFTCSTGVSNPQAIALAKTLSDIAPGKLSRTFFSNSGSEAVETAMKIALETQALRGFPSRSRFIARRGSFHGMTMGALSVTSLFRAHTERVFPGACGSVSFVASPNDDRPGVPAIGEEGERLCVKSVEDEINLYGAESIAAVIAEPISASNGVHVPTRAYFQGLSALCKKHGILLIIDEVLTGFGRTGSMFASDHDGIEPDIFAVAKGIASGYASIGATLVTDEVFAPFAAEGASLHHTNTFGGSAVACAAASENIRILLDEKLAQRAAENGLHIESRLRALKDKHEHVGDVRGKGHLWALDIVSDRKTKQPWAGGSPFGRRFSQLMSERRVFTRLMNVVHFAPPLVATREEIDTMIDAIDDSIGVATKELAK
jgi:adenosylmethionine-8-amino-7-oxononanoate aminotransferase